MFRSKFAYHLKRTIKCITFQMMWLLSKTENDKYSLFSLPHILLGKCWDIKDSHSSQENTQISVMKFLWYYITGVYFTQAYIGALEIQPSCNTTSLYRWWWVQYYYTAYRKPDTHEGNVLYPMLLCRGQGGTCREFAK